MKIKTIHYILLLFIASNTLAQVTITVASIPDDTAMHVELFLAGNFNGWNPGDASHRLTKNRDGKYNLSFTPSKGVLEYKITRGSWESTETDSVGIDIPNRTMRYTGSPILIEVDIAGWKVQKIDIGSAAENVLIIEEDFLIPQLGINRRIWLYLPPDYNTSGKTYSVLYMHDGQNLFDRRTSFLDEWQVDESLNRLFDKGDDGIIVIGIDNGGDSRINEYSPWDNLKYGGGQGKQYMDFIVETLKPYIDNNYRTKPDRQHTGIMGSSMGGLISLYGAIEHQEVFGKVGVFSPSFWFSDKIFSHVTKKGKELDMKIYLLGGKLESSELIQAMNKMIKTLKNVGFNDTEIKMIIREDGKHTESFWQREFSECFLWLFR